MNPKNLAVRFNINAILNKSATERKTFLDRMLYEKKEAELSLEKAEKYLALDNPSVIKNREALKILELHIAKVCNTLPADIFITPGFVLVHAGKFVMGADSPSDNPKHNVTLTHNFELGQYQVTQADYLKYKADYEFAFAGKAKNPAENINWRDAVGYCQWLSLQAKDIQQKYKDAVKELSTEDYVEYAIKHPEAKLYRLPTEAEWEYAAREEGQSTTMYLGKDDLSDLDEYAIHGNGKQKNKSTAKVGSKKPNKLGLYDMIGNVLEWCIDGYDKDFFNDSKNEYEDPCNLKENSIRVLRGGSWDARGDWYFKSACRIRSVPAMSANVYGFRLARTVDYEVSVIEKKNLSRLEKIKSKIQGIIKKEGVRP